MDDFNFENINYPLKEKDYETFENNNLSIKLPIFKIIEDEGKLYIHYNRADNNDKENKINLLLLGNNHYIYISKFSSLSKFVVCK